MKTVYFEKSSGCDWEDHYFPVVEYSGIDHSGTYVLASEANERIKVLEDALKTVREYLMGSSWRYVKSPDEFIKEALEVK
jgi:hypothetical protein